MWRVGLRRRGLALALGGGALASGLLAAFTGSLSTAYYGTHTRAVELLTGGVLAVVLGRLLARRPTPRRAALTSLAGCIALIGLFLVARFGHADSSTLVHGGLAAISLLSAAAVATAATDTMVATVLGWWPLRWLGRISYAVYLFHWPIYLWFRNHHLEGVAWSAFATVLTIALAALSYHLLEQPIRVGRVLRHRAGVFTSARRRSPNRCSSSATTR